MTSDMNNDVSKITQKEIEYIWEPRHHDAACIINHYVRLYFINFAKVLKPLIQSVVEAGADLLDKKVQYFVYNKHRDTQTIFNMLSGCRCCQRHQLNKPKAMERWVETKFNMTQTTPCECICRHYMRWMCREC